MQRIFITALLFLTCMNFSMAQVAINSDGSPPDNSAMLDIKSSDRGVLLPCMTQANRENITVLTRGLLVFQTDGSSGFYYYTGAAWKLVTADLTAGPGISINNNQVVNTAPDQTIVMSGMTGIKVTGSYPDFTLQSTLLPGINPGDMLYWDGSQWNLIPIGSPGQLLRFSDSNIPVWVGAILTTTPAINITSTSATSGGNITNDGGDAIMVRGVCWSTYHFPTIADAKTSNGSGTGSYPSSLTGLTFNTTYYVRAYAVNNFGTWYGNEISFTANSALPTLTTTSISNIMGTSASGGGNVLTDGGVSVTARGVCWSTSSDPTTANSHTSDGSGTGSFTSSLAGLSLGTTYYVRAYATNSNGTAYGDQVIFSTPALPTLTTTAISNITLYSATSGGNVTNNGGASVTARGVCWSTTSGPTVSDSKTSDGTGNGSFTSSLTSLAAGTTYYVRAYATNTAGTGYGNEVVFTTCFVPVHNIGDSYGGGIVFYVDCSGEHGLIAATADLGLYHWGCEGTFMLAFGTAVYTGSANTTAIINGCSTANIAAKIAHNFNGGGYTDWYLPSKDELILLCSQQNVVGGFTTWYYWSSTELSATNAFAILFPSCAQINRLKDTSEGDHGEAVRPIRAF
jgi:hypothetical protein